jgi:hypothetical protein
MLCQAATGFEASARCTRVSGVLVTVLLAAW